MPPGLLNGPNMHFRRGEVLLSALDEYTGHKGGEVKSPLLCQMRMSEY
jgi:hypothetical protein